MLKLRRDIHIREGALKFVVSPEGTREPRVSLFVSGRKLFTDIHARARDGQFDHVFATLLLHFQELVEGDEEVAFGNKFILEFSNDHVGEPLAINIGAERRGADVTSLGGTLEPLHEGGEPIVSDTETAIPDREV